MIGQIYALLYLSPIPLCLDEIATELGVSKASVSTTVRQLERWTAVKKIWVRGDRRDFYEAETDFQSVLKHGVLATVRKKLETAGQQMKLVEESLLEAGGATGNGAADDAGMKVVRERLRQARKFHGRINGLLGNPLLEKLL